MLQISTEIKGKRNKGQITKLFQHSMYTGLEINILRILVVWHKKRLSNCLVFLY